ncbi:MAG: DUF58 domain-containing protein [Planctomycetota bacterium]
MPTPTAATPPKVILAPPIMHGPPVTDLPSGAGKVEVDWSRNGWLLLTSGVLVAIVGLVSRSAEVIALGITFDCVVLGSAWWASRAIRFCAVRREYQSRLLDQQDVEISWRIVSRSRLPLLFAQWSDACGLQKGPKPAGVIDVPIRRGTGVRVSYTLECDRGRGAWPVGPGLLEGGDPLGLFRVRRVVPVAPEPIRVYPRPLDAGALPFVGQQPWQRTGRRSVQFAGIGPDFSGTREFRPGDSPRHIHWRSTARLGQLVVKEFDQIIRPDISVLLDLSREARLGTGEHSTSGYAIRIAGSIAAWALERGHRTQVIANQGEQIIASTLGSGPDHLLRIFDELAAWRPTGAMPLADLVEQADRAGLIPMGSVAVLIAPSRILFLSELARLFARFDAGHVDVIALALSEHDFIPLHTGQRMTAADSDRARQAAASLLLRGIEVNFVDVDALVGTRNRPKRARA